MTAPLKKVQSGDPLEIPAATFNAFVDAARDFQERQRSTDATPGRPVRQTGLVPVSNDTGASRNRFDVLGIKEPLLDPKDALEAFQERIALRGKLPTADHRSRFAILLEPLAEGAVGLACIDGMCVARVEMISEHHRFADVKPDDASMLQSGSSGAQLLWIQPEEEREDPAIAWVVARLGTPPGAVAQRARLVGYSDDHDHFEGILIDEYDADVGGTSGEIFCWKYPIADEDIRKYIPPLVPNDDPQLSPHVPVVQQTVLLPGEDEPRAVWIIDGFFTLTCYDVLLSQRREVQPSPPGAPVTPTDVQQPGGPFIGR